MPTSPIVMADTDIGAMYWCVNADAVADRVADVSANSLALRESAHCNRSLD
jgi:hypothetical protein